MQARKREGPLWVNSAKSDQHRPCPHNTRPRRSLVDHLVVRGLYRLWHGDREPFADQARHHVGRCRSLLVRLPRPRPMDLFWRRLFQHRDAPHRESEGCLSTGAGTVRKRELRNGLSPLQPSNQRGENIEPLLRERLDHVGADFRMGYASATTPLQNWFLLPMSTSYLRTKSSSPSAPIR
jgi:hypothetical protein